MKKLNDRERKVLKESKSAPFGGERTDAEIAEELGISEQRVQSIRQQAFRKIVEDEVVAELRGRATRGARYQTRSLDEGMRTVEQRHLAEMNFVMGTILDNAAKGQLRGDEVFEIGVTSDAMKLAGIEELPVSLDASVITKAKEKHGLTDNELRQVPYAPYNPVMIFESSDRSTNFDNGFVVLTQVRDADGNPVIIALNVDTTNGHHQVNEISSVYGKGRGSAQWVLDWIKDGRLKYSHRKRALAFARSHRLQLPKEATISERSSHIIIDETEDVKPQLQETGEKIVRGAYTPLTKTVHLFEKADGSTFAHETYHYMMDLRSVRETAERLADDMPVYILEKLAGERGAVPLPSAFLPEAHFRRSRRFARISDGCRVLRREQARECTRGT